MPAGRTAIVPVLVWSPDSKKIATFQQDQRGVGEMYLVDTKVGHPTLQAWKYPLPGDEVVTTIQRVIIEVDTPRVIRLQVASRISIVRLYVMTSSAAAVNGPMSNGRRTRRSWRLSPLRAITSTRNFALPTRRPETFATCSKKKLRPSTSPARAE